MEYVWINTGGETCCGKKVNHGGMSLMAAVEAKEWRKIPGEGPAVELLTDRDHWVGLPLDEATISHNGVTHELRCEYCELEVA